MADQVITGVIVADATREGFPLVEVSPGFEALTGFTAAEIVEMGCAVLQGADTDPRAVDVLRRALADGAEAQTTLVNYRADGSPFWNEVTLVPQRDAAGGVVRFIGVQKDVSARVGAEARIHELAYFDSLTGLANRACMQSRLRSTLAGAHASDGQLAVLFVDIDDFKRVNDTHGHLVGDALLGLVADRLRTIVRTGDLLARPGGDEFLVLACAADGIEERSRRLAARLVEVLRDPFELPGLTPLKIRASVGVSLFPHDAAGSEDLLRHADAAMYLAKHAGKNDFRIYRANGDPRGRTTAIDPRIAAGELARILSGHLVTAVFQPIVNIESGVAIGYEALTRGPAGSPLTRPDLLFAAAAEAGRLNELDWLCRATAVRSALNAGLGRSATLFVNCEPSTVGMDCPAEHVEVWSRAETELDLVLEITERAVLDRPAELALEIDAHRMAGRGVALDDIGADVRSLALLPLIEPDIIKLDLRLVQGRPSTDQAAIISAVAAEHESTGAAILAEGVETEQHAATARTLGATLGQGWYWGRPGPLPASFATAPPRPVRQRRVPSGDTPFEVISRSRPTATATKRLLLPMSHHLEHRALRIGEGAVILSAFQSAERFTAKTMRRYEMLAHSASLVAALGVGLDPTPVPGVRGAHLDVDDPLAAEWSVLVIGPHFAGALVARDLGDEGPEPDRRFTFATSYDRALVIAAAMTLLTRIAPHAGGSRTGLSVEPAL